MSWFDITDDNDYTTAYIEARARERRIAAARAEQELDAKIEAKVKEVLRDMGVIE